MLSLIVLQAIAMKFCSYTVANDERIIIIVIIM